MTTAIVPDPERGCGQLKPGGCYSEKEIARFWSYVDRSGECWLWTRALNSAGYGQFCTRGRQYGSHRVAFELTYGPLGADQVLHRCDNPACCRPQHLARGTQLDNMRDMIAKGRKRNEAAEEHHAARLTWEAVRDIRRRSAAGTATHAQLAAEYQVHRRTVGDVVNNTTWKE